MHVGVKICAFSVPGVGTGPRSSPHDKKLELTTWSNTQVLAKVQLKDTVSIVLLLQMSLISSLFDVLSTCVAVYATPEPLRVSSVMGIVRDVIPLLACGVLYAILQVWSIDVLERVPVTAHAVLNVGKKFSLVVISTWRLTWDLALALAAQGVLASPPPLHAMISIESVLWFRCLFSLSCICALIAVQYSEYGPLFIRRHFGGHVSLLRMPRVCESC